MVEMIMQGRRRWPCGEGEAHRTLRHLLKANGRR